jgi:uncharacterized GH25 family protein
MKTSWRLVVLACWCSAAQAHEFWLWPDSFRPALGADVQLELRVGAGWPGETLPRDPARIVRFSWLDRRGEGAISGTPGLSPAGTARARAAGAAQVVYRSNASAITLEAAVFEKYLRDEGLERISEWRAQRGQTDVPVRERFSRNAKLLLHVGAAPPRATQPAAGLALELMARTSLSALRGGGSLQVQLLYRGRPLAGALVKALPQDTSQTASNARTDARGRATLPLSAGGVWLVNAVHMTAAPHGSGADWESLWSSLVFELER